MDYYPEAQIKGMTSMGNILMEKITVLDCNMIEKQRYHLPTYGIRPIWIWFWISMRRIGYSIHFVELKESHLYPSSQVLGSFYLIVYIDQYIPESLINYINMIVSQSPNMKICICGYLPTLYSEHFRKLILKSDLILKGVLEQVLFDFIRQLSKETLLSLKKFDFPQKHLEEMHSLDIKCYGKLFLNNGLNVLQASTGCPMTCSFCRYSYFYHKYFKKVYTQYPLVDITREIKYLYDHYHITHFRFLDSNFLGTSSIALKRCRELELEIARQKLKVTFELHARSDTITDKTVELLKKSGLNHLTLGIESMSPTQLKRYGKREDIKQHQRAIQSLSNHGILTQGYVILFDPLVTRKELLESLEGIYALSRNCLIVIHMKMILYRSTYYFKKNSNQIILKTLREDSIQEIMDYDFCDFWCKTNYNSLETINTKMDKIIFSFYKRKNFQFVTDSESYSFLKQANHFRLSILLELAKEEVIRQEKVNNMTAEFVRQLTEAL